MVAQHVLLIFIPETSPWLRSDLTHSTSGLESAGQSGSPIEGSRQPATSWSPTSPFRHAGHFLRHPGLRIIFGCFFAKRIGFASEGLTFQYASERFHVNFANTVWLRVSNALGAVLVLGIILPLLTSDSKKWNPVKDVRVIRGSLSTAVAGFLVLWQGWALSILCIGIYCPPSLSMRLCAANTDAISRHGCLRSMRGLRAYAAIPRSVHCR